MTTRAWGNEYRATTVCIDSYDNGVLEGRFYNPYLKSGMHFHSLSQFLLELDRALDAMNFPQSFTATRSFAPAPPRPPNLSEIRRLQGERATFTLRILFRQNASWQGSILWQEGGLEQSFRSTLELIFLMDNALTQTKEERVG